jgi:hypothetical protein
MFQLAARDANNQNTNDAPQTARCTLNEIVGFSRFQYMNHPPKKGRLGTPGSTLVQLVSRRFQHAGILVLAFPALVCITYLTSIIREHPFVPPSLLALFFWPVGVPLLALFTVSGLGLL